MYPKGIFDQIKIKWILGGFVVTLGLSSAATSVKFCTCHFYGSSDSAHLMRLNFALPGLVLSCSFVDLPCVPPAQDAAALDSLLPVVLLLDLLSHPCGVVFGFGSEETDSELLDSIPPSE